MAVNLHIESRNGSSERIELALKGELDLGTAAWLRDALRDASRRHDEVIVDLRGVTFLDSTGLRVLIAALRESESGGWSLGVVPGPERVQRVFEVSGTADLLPFVQPA